MPRTHKETPLSTDWFTKLVLAVLAACAVVFAAHELRGPGSGADAITEEGRFRIQVLPMARMMLKIDSETGKTWRASFPEPKVWLPIADEPVDTLDDEEPEPDEFVDEPEETEPEPPAPAEPMTPDAP